MFLLILRSASILKLNAKEKKLSQNISMVSNNRVIVLVAEDT